MESLSPICDDEEVNIMIDGSTKPLELCDEMMIMEDGERCDEYVKSNITQTRDINTAEENFDDR